VMIRIGDVHGWMHSYAGVLDHPYYSVTGAELSTALPRGGVIESWHESTDPGQTVTVGRADQGHHLHLPPAS
jgi:hypothetical protein